MEFWFLCECIFSCIINVSCELAGVPHMHCHHSLYLWSQRLCTLLHVYVFDGLACVMMLGMHLWQRCLHWKLVIALPVNGAMQQYTSLSDWLKYKFSVGSVPSKQANSEVNIAAHGSNALSIMWSVTVK